MFFSLAIGEEGGIDIWVFREFLLARIRIFESLAISLRVIIRVIHLPHPPLALASQSKEIPHHARPRQRKASTSPSS